jgi:hypothetical protein
MTDALTEKVKELGITLYSGTPDEDVIIAQWWDLLFGTPEFADLVSSSAYSLSAFYSMFKPPNMMAYTVKDDAIESVHWAEPISTSPHAIFFSSWCAEELRGTKRQAILMTTLYQLLFSMGKRVILGITKQEKLLDLHRKLGYVILDPVPFLFDDASAWVMYLTKDAFEHSRLYVTANKIMEVK